METDGLSNRATSIQKLDSVMSKERFYNKDGKCDCYISG